MSFVSKKSAYWAGVRSALPFLLVLPPFAVLFGVLATEAGLKLAEVMGFSVLVIAGAAQYTALQLMSENAPTIIVLISALTVNLRMGMYSASLAPHLGPAPLKQRLAMGYMLFDQPYVTSISQFEKHPDMPVLAKAAFFFGTASPLVPVWYLFTLIGALVGKAIPAEFALDFAVPITFLALVAPGLRTIPHLAAAGSGIVLSLLLAGLPFSIGVLIAGALAIVIGAEVERRMSKRAQA